MSRTLLLGGRGQVGTALRAVLDDVVSPTRSSFDLEKASADDITALIQDAAADILINCAAYTAVDQAEVEQERAFRLNTHAVGVLAEVTAEMHIPFVTFSTDYVFDGESNSPYVESDTPHPLNVYGLSKAEGERLALERNPRTLVVRTSWVLSRTHSNFAIRILDAVATGEAVKVVNDQRGSPTVSGDLAAITAAAVAKDASGFVHVSNYGEASWFELARAVVAAAGLDVDLVVPCSTSERPTKAVRPRYSVLESLREEELGLDTPRPWDEAVAGLFADRRGRLAPP